MEIVGKSQVALGNRGNWCYPFENQDTLGTETLVIDLKFDIAQRIMPNWLSNWEMSVCCFLFVSVDKTIQLTEICMEVEQKQFY